MHKVIHFFKIEFDNSRVFGLDILRFIAIFWVILAHGLLIIPGNNNSVYLKFCEFIDGVTLFFVLSGFLIGQLLIHHVENKEISKNELKIFWKKRILRIVPAYYFILILLIILSLITIKGFGNLKLLLYFIFSQNVFYNHPYFFSEAWSLSIEIWFYILAPLTLFLIKKNTSLTSKNSVFYTILFFILVGFIGKVMHFITLEKLDVYSIDYIFRKQVVSRLDGIAFGFLGAFFNRYYFKYWSKYKYVFLILGLGLYMYSKFPIFNNSLFFRLVIYYQIQALAFVLILPFFNSIEKGSGLLYKSISTISILSYSIYLINLNVVQIFLLNKIEFLNSTDLQMQLLKYSIYIILSYFGSILLYKFIELPYMNKRNKIK